MENNFAKLISDAEEHLARGRFQDALTAYKQVMPYQPENARLRAGMAWTMIKLNRQPMADNVWRVATQTPDAVAELGDALKAKGDVEGAKAVWQRLKESVPSYAPKLEGKL
jgi:thioredoxin-like negative regulator of GroEL